MDRQYMRSDLKDDYGILDLQDKILEIMTYVDDFCRRNEIEYCLMGGSALGAQRHGGFIPWDDDLDIFMTPDSYDKFKTSFQKQGDQMRFYLQEWGLSNDKVTISKLRMNNTTYIEELLKNWDIHQGIYVDIFILHTCPDKKLQQLHQWFWAKYTITKGLAVRGYAGRKGLVGFLLKIASLLPDHFLIEHGLKQVYKYRDKKTGLFCNFMGKAVFKKGIYNREWFEDTVYAPFETIYLKVPEKLHEFLSERFNNYMVIPSEKQIKREQHAEFWDTKLDFREYCININNFEDEGKLI